MTWAPVLLVLAFLRMPVATQSTVVTAEDLAVIDAALDHEARNAERGPRVLLLLDQTLEPCAADSPVSCIPHGDKTLKYVQRTMRELTNAHLEALVARNAVARPLPAPPARDVILVSRENLATERKKRDANVVAFTSLPAYSDDGTALVFLGYSCGGRCGEGNFILLRHDSHRWRVVKAAMTWIS